MPKRLCAVKLTPDEKTIIVGDKFGDVYSLPLEPSADWEARPRNTPQGDYKPSASELTVHTQGNLEALRQQRQQQQPQKKKERPDFEHDLLLGHVSLLTDVEIVELQADSRKRQYILTSDRDEHIRVSRGIPQTHIIESYCDPNDEFITKLCIVPWDPNILVVGSGDIWLKFNWWRKGETFQMCNLAHMLDQAMEENGMSMPSARSLEKLAVSGMWAVRIDQTNSSPAKHAGDLLVGLEGYVLFYFADGST